MSRWLGDGSARRPGSLAGWIPSIRSVGKHFHASGFAGYGAGWRGARAHSGCRRNDVTAKISQGKLAGLLDIRNNVLPSIIGNAYQQGDLNVLAQGWPTG